MKQKRLCLAIALLAVNVLAACPAAAQSFRISGFALVGHEPYRTNSNLWASHAQGIDHVVGRAMADRDATLVIYVSRSTVGYQPPFNRGSLQDAIDGGMAVDLGADAMAQAMRRGLPRERIQVKYLPQESPEVTVEFAIERPSRPKKSLADMFKRSSVASAPTRQAEPTLPANISITWNGHNGRVITGNGNTIQGDLIFNSFNEGPSDDDGNSTASSTDHTSFWITTNVMGIRINGLNVGGIGGGLRIQFPNKRFLGGDFVYWEKADWHESYLSFYAGRNITGPLGVAAMLRSGVRKDLSNYGIFDNTGGSVGADLFLETNSIAFGLFLGLELSNFRDYPRTGSTEINVNGPGDVDITEESTLGSADLKLSPIVKITFALKLY